MIGLQGPAAVLLMVVLRSDSTEDLGPCLDATYRDLLVPGSYLSLSHVTDTEISRQSAAMLGEPKSMYANSVSAAIFRVRKGITALSETSPSWNPGPPGHPTGIRKRRAGTIR
ncbi:hypothetical protein [Lentzea albida]|uniref:Uncharacterized protein n=1 Tax=Lentzea albida TaxID=65499 RepID=A0A1H9PR03_9PSEU|nr:hypothetical protein [Lentzea albida]SER50682.1 hypothetical protein SAMN04488000_109224 [Lentzea albida]